MPDPNASSSTRWSIADVERDTGLHKDTLRVWERRYGFPTPTRDANGERVYDQAQLERLMLIKRLLDAGHRPGKVVALPTAELVALLHASCAAPTEQEPDRGLDRWLELLAPGGQSRLRPALVQELQRLGLAQAIEQLLVPLGRRIGDAWLAGQLSIHQEHWYSETLQSVLREAIAALDSAPASEPQPPRVLLTTLPQEQHQLGLLMAECYFALERCERIALGPSTPLPEIAAAVAGFGIDAVALSVSVHASSRDVCEQLALLRQLLPHRVELWVGGGWTTATRSRLPAGVQRMHNAAQVAAGVARWRAAKRQ